MTRNFIKYYPGDQIKEDEIGLCGTHGGRNIHSGFWLRNFYATQPPTKLGWEYYPFLKTRKGPLSWKVDQSYIQAKNSLSSTKYTINHYDE
jgi:hypothetical protein